MGLAAFQWIKTATPKKAVPNIHLEKHARLSNDTKNDLNKTLSP
jgi:hypothetical protein